MNGDKIRLDGCFAAIEFRLADPVASGPLATCALQQVDEGKANSSCSVYTRNRFDSRTDQHCRAQASASWSARLSMMSLKARQANVKISVSFDLASSLMFDVCPCRNQGCALHSDTSPTRLLH